MEIKDDWLAPIFTTPPGSSIPVLRGRKFPTNVSPGQWPVKGLHLVTSASPATGGTAAENLRHKTWLRKQATVLSQQRCGSLKNSTSFWRKMTFLLKFISRYIYHFYILHSLCSSEQLLLISINYMSHGFICACSQHKHHFPSKNISPLPTALTEFTYFLLCFITSPLSDENNQMLMKRYSKWKTSLQRQG